MSEERMKARQAPDPGYRERVDFGRKIHLRLDDGALLALCEDYRDDEAGLPES